MIQDMELFVMRRQGQMVDKDAIQLSFHFASRSHHGYFFALILFEMLHEFRFDDGNILGFPGM